MTKRNQQLIASLEDGPLSGYEWACWQDCENCEYGVQYRLQKMKELQAVKNWLEMSNIRGWCLYPFGHSYDQETKPWTCQDWKAKRMIADDYPVPHKKTQLMG